MTSRHLIDDSLKAFVEHFPPARLSNETLSGLRESMSTMCTPFRHVTGRCEMAEVNAAGIPGRPPVRMLVMRPTSPTGLLPVILHLHGGLFVLGCADESNMQNERRVAALNCAVVAVDYRLAPESPYPEPLEDCYAALGWIHTHAVEWGFDRQRVAVVGESAGGGLAASLALLARDRAQYDIAFLQLLYPMLDDRTGSREVRNPYAGEFILTPEICRAAWQMYLGFEPGGERTPAGAAVARARHLEKLPPTYIAVGSLDLFVDENIAYAHRLLQSGVATELHIYPGAVHAFDLGSTSGVAEHFTHDHWRALKRALRVTA